MKGIAVLNILSAFLVCPIIASWSVPSSVPQPKTTVPEEMCLGVTDLIKYWGYPVEEHVIRTDDGYYLKLHRIPRGRTENMTSRPIRGPILLLHGILLDSSSYVLNLPHQSLGFVLANAGFDVWMGNNRGNIQSKRHQFHPVNSSQFWDFSWDEMATYDLPAMVDYILKTTNHQQLFFVGCSQGTMVAFAGLSENPHLQKKIKKIFALAPVTRLSHVPTWARAAALLEPLWRKQIIKRFHIHEFMGWNQYWEAVAEILCPLDLDFCQRIYLFLFGGNPSNFNLTRYPMYQMHVPLGISMKAVQHYMQAIRSNEFKKYDHGPMGNLIMYGSIHPPAYNLTKVEVPVVLFSGSVDPLASPMDVKWTEEQLPFVDHVVVDGYGHFDFLAGLDVKEKVYDKLIKLAQ